MKPLGLLLILFLCLVAGSAETSKQHDPMKPVNLEGDDTFLLDYKELYRTAFSGKPALFYTLTTFLTIVLFYMMYVMADRHLTWSLEHLAKFCRMSPDMAGMTFLAFGNGAPDFFTAVFGAVRSPGLILGSSVGAGLFVMSIVLGMVILLAARPKSDFTVIKRLEEGKSVEPKSPMTLQDGSLPVLSAASKRILNQPKVSPTPYIRNGLLYGICLAFLALFAFKKEIPLWQPCLLIGIYLAYMSSVVGIHYYQELQAKRAAKRIRRSFSNTGQTQTSTSDGVNTSMKLREQEAFQELEDLPIYHRIPAAVLRTSWTFAERTGVPLLDVALLVIKAPIDLLFNITVPPMESIEDASTCPPHMAAVRLTHRIRSIVFPWGFCFLAASLLTPEVYLFTWPWWLTYVLTSTALSSFMFFTTSNREDPKCFLPHVMLAFCSCILWIYAVSSELVSCLNSTGELANISPTIMGIVVLAWGNSFGDLVADVAMAKNGHFETAISAVFCGPIQNVLLTIGTSFMIACLQSPHQKISFPELGGDIYLALGTLAVVFVLLMIAIPVLGRFRVPRWLGWSLLVIYIVYLPIAILNGVGVIPFF